MAEKTPPEKKEKTLNELLDGNERRLRSPILWFFLLLLPVLISFYSAFRSMSDNSMFGQAAEVIKYAPPDVVQKAEGPEATPGDFVQYEAQGAELRKVRGNEGGFASGGRGTGAPACRYEDWIGKVVDAAFQERMKAEKRPYRILPPGALYTKNYNAARINVKTDADGRIVRVWCG